MSCELVTAWRFEATRRSMPSENGLSRASSTGITFAR
jgi:hypothetical protein